MPNIIALSGKRGVGKTTAADYLVKTYGFKKVSFAAKLKEIGQSIFPAPPEFHKERPYFKSGEGYRSFLISLGQLVRYYSEDYWVEAVGLDKVRGNIVIDDLRFTNEIRKIKEVSGRVIRINRYERLNVYGKNLDDPSETSLDDCRDFDYVVEDCVNIKLADLYNQLDVAMDNFGVKKERA